MKKINKILLGILGVSVLLFSSCSDKEVVRESSPLQTGTQAYFSTTNATSYSFLPTDSPFFNVVIGRNNTKGKAIVKYKVTDSDKVFVLADSVIFNDGVALDTIKVNFAKMVIGTTSTISLKIDTLSTTVYGDASISVTVLRDYKWLDAGVAHMTSGWAGGEANISVQHADATSIYRLVSPFYILEPAYCPKPGYHVQFILDANYNAASLPMFQDIGEPASTGGTYWLYWNPAKTYCSFTNVGNSFTIKGAWGKGVSTSAISLVTYATESFVWTKGYPGTN